MNYQTGKNGRSTELGSPAPPSRPGHALHLGVLAPPPGAPFALPSTSLQLGKSVRFEGKQLGNPIIASPLSHAFSSSFSPKVDTHMSLSSTEEDKGTINYQISMTVSFSVPSQGLRPDFIAYVSVPPAKMQAFVLFGTIVRILLPARSVTLG